MNDAKQATGAGQPGRDSGGHHYGRNLPGFQAVADGRLQTPGAAHPESDAVLAKRLATAQDSIWRQAVAATPRCQNPQAAALLLDALNAMFDAGTRHRAAFNAHTPVAILALLLLVAIFAAVLAGHDMAGQGRFNWLHIVVFAAVVSLTIWVIYDLEMPRYRLIRIDNYDQTLLDLRDSIQRGP